MLRYIILDRPGVHDHIAGWRGRCTYCGHRVGPGHRFVAGGWPDSDECMVVSLPRGEVCGRPERDHPYVVETRRQPWRIPAELVGRWRAMRHTPARAMQQLYDQAAERLHLPPDEFVETRRTRG